jgi:hypothetical protein
VSTFDGNEIWTTRDLAFGHDVRNWSNQVAPSTLLFVAPPPASMTFQLYAGPSISGPDSVFYDLQVVDIPDTLRNTSLNTITFSSVSVFTTTTATISGLVVWPQFTIVNRAGATMSPLRQDSLAWGTGAYGGYRDDTGTLRSADSTIAYGGCLLTCIAMMQRYFGMDPGRARPDSLNDFLQRRFGYLPAAGVVVDTAGATAVPGDILHFQWGVSRSSPGTTFDVEGGTDSLAPYPIATVRVVNADSIQGRAEIVSVQRPGLGLVGRQGTNRGNVAVYRSAVEYSGGAWYSHGLDNVDSVEVALEDSLPVALNVTGGGHWVVASGRAPAWLSSTDAHGTYTVVDPLVSGARRLIESPFGNTFLMGIAGRRALQNYPAPARALATTEAGITPELALVLSGPVAATIVAPDGRTISYSEVTGQYASEVPGVIARRGVRQGNTNDPGGLSSPIDVIEIPDAASGVYAVVLKAQGTGAGGLLAEGNYPGVRIADALRRFVVTVGEDRLCHVTYDATGGTAVAMTSVTGVEAGVPPAHPRLRVAPNPVVGLARISFDAPVGGRGRIDVLDVQGRRVATLFEGIMESGRHVVEWAPKGNPVALRTGMYFVRLAIGKEKQVTRVIVVGE